MDESTKKEDLNLRSMGFVQLGAGPSNSPSDKIIEVECQCGAKGEVLERWLTFTSRIVRVGPKMYMRLPNRWYQQVLPFAEPLPFTKSNTYICAHCLFEKTYEILSGVRSAMQKHGEFERLPPD